MKNFSKLDRKCLRLFLLAAVLLLAVFLPLKAQMQPDLVVKEIVLAPESPRAGDIVTIKATVANQGASAPESFNVRFKVDNAQIAVVRVPLGLRSGASKIVEAQWTAIEGDHIIAVTADAPFDNVSESNELNNTLQITVTIGRVGRILRSVPVVIAPFADSSGSPIIGLGEGVANTLKAALIKRREFTVIETELRGLPLDLAIAAAERAGAELLITGSITELTVGQNRVKVRLDATIIEVKTARATQVVSAEVEKVTISISISFWFIFQPFQPICVPPTGLKVSKPSYFIGEVVSFGFYNAGPGTINLPNSAPWRIRDAFGAIIFTPMSLPVVTPVGPGGCLTWSWDQRNSLGFQVPPGTYVVELDTIELGTLSAFFTIGPGTPTTFLELKFESPQVQGSLIGEAVREATDKLAGSLSRSDIVTKLASQARVIDLFDDTIVLNFGKKSDARVGDLLEVFRVVREIIDPLTGKVLETIEEKIGEIQITEIRENVSFARKIGVFEIKIGDIVRFPKA